MMPSRLAQMTVTGEPRRFSSSSSASQVGPAGQVGHPHDRAAGCGPGSAGRPRRITGSTRVAWRIGQTSRREVQAPVPQRPLGDRGEHLAPLPGRAADRVDQHERADTVGVVVGDADGHAAAEGVPDHHHLLLEPDGPHELLQPAPRSRRAWKSLRGRSGVPPKPGQRGGADLAALLGQPLQHRLVGVLAERPAVQRTRPADPRRPRRRTPAGPGPRCASRRPGAARGARASPASPGLSPVVASSALAGLGLRRSPGLTPRSQAVEAPCWAEQLLRSISFRPPQIPWGSRIVRA